MPTTLGKVRLRPAPVKPARSSTLVSERTNRPGRSSSPSRGAAGVGGNVPGSKAGTPLDSETESVERTQYAVGRSTRLKVTPAGGLERLTIGVLVDEDLSGAGEEIAMPSADPLSLWVDGEASARRPTDRPYILQAIETDGVVETAVGAVELGPELELELEPPPQPQQRNPSLPSGRRCRRLRPTLPWRLHGQPPVLQTGRPPSPTCLVSTRLERR